MKNDEAADHCETLAGTADMHDFFREALTLGAAALRAEAKFQDGDRTAGGMRVDAKRMAEIQTRVDAAFRGPWTHGTFTVECAEDDPRCPDPTPDECQGERDVLRIEAPEEYPDDQVVCDVYGLETFAAANAAFLAHARSDVPDLLADLVESRAEMTRAAQEAAALMLAIRAFTMDKMEAGQYVPNGPAETAWARLADAILALRGPVGRKLGPLVSEYLDADIDRLRALRDAAEAFFGEDFREAVRP